MKFIKIIIIIFITLFIIGLGGLFYLSRGLDSQSKLIVNKVNFESLDDGVYQGDHLADRWSNKLKVTIKDKKISKIEIINDVLFPQEHVSRELFKRVIAEQVIDVDLVSGATVTSKAYLKAIENALLK